MIERIDPQFSADERATLTEFLDYYRATLWVKIDGLSDDQARDAAVPPSDLNLLGLVRHMAEVERSWFQCRLLGADAPPLYFGASHPTGDQDGDLHPGAADTVEEGLATWQREVEVSRAITANQGLDDMAVTALGTGERVSLRWILVHMIEEYARHCGHADLLRERIDGSTGD